MNKSMLLMIIFFLPSVAMNEQQEGRNLGEKLKDAGVHEIDAMLERVMKKPHQVAKIEAFINGFSAKKETVSQAVVNPRNGRMELERIDKFTIMSSANSSPMSSSPPSSSSSVGSSPELRRSDDQKARIKAHAMKVIAAEILRKSDEMLRASSGLNNSTELFLQEIGLIDISDADPAMFETSFNIGGADPSIFEGALY